MEISLMTLVGVWLMGLGVGIISATLWLWRVR